MYKFSRLTAGIMMAAAIGAPAAAQSWDASGNSQLKGTYYFREAIWVLGDNSGNLGEGYALYGNIQFDGNGNYSITSAQFLDGFNQTLEPYTSSGTYAVSSAGYAYLSSPLSTNPATSESVYGLVSNGIFIGSSTENQSGFNDLFIAAPMTTTQATNATLKGSYVVADLDTPLAYESSSPEEARQTLMLMTADGAGNLGTVQASGFIGASGATRVTQNLTGVTYSFSGGAGVVHLGAPLTSADLNSNLIGGDHDLYISPDGNFVFGGSPTGWDMFVGVRTGANPNVNGLYYQAGVDQNEAGLADGSADFDSYYGSLKVESGTVIEHQRTLDAVDFYQGSGAFDATYSDNYIANSNGTANDSFQTYYYGGGGTYRIGIGTAWPNLGISVALAAPALGGSGVYLNPTGIENAASSALFTSSIAPGELITLYGSGLAADSESSYLMPTMLDSVQVLINGIAAPIYVTSPGALVVMVPYQVAGSISSGVVTRTVANIQVINRGTVSNTIMALAGVTAPGVFTVPVGGIGSAAAEHANGALITPASPAQAGETFAVYVTGLGAVSPAIKSGSPGPSNPPSLAVNEIDAYIGSKPAKATFAGLTPTAIGLYQVNVTVPAGVANGENAMQLAGPDSDTFEASIWISGGEAAATPVPARRKVGRRTRGGYGLVK
jgi:uncharacterized protein (TIGR03437 family)